jgi:hypothetical protein
LRCAAHDQYHPDLDFGRPSWSAGAEELPTFPGECPENGGCAVIWGFSISSGWRSAPDPQ